MINLPSREEFEILKTVDEKYCLSIYAPYIEPNSDVSPNRIELKNLLRDATKELTAAGMEEKALHKMLRPVRELLENLEFWREQHESLALFVNPNLFQCYKLPGKNIPYQSSVRNGFDVAPLEKIMLNNKSYYILALSHNDVQLFEGDHYQLKQLHPKDFPSNMEKTLNIDEMPKVRELHVIAPASEGKGSEAYHGQYNASQTDKDMLLQFFRRINVHIHALLTPNHAPLIIAGVGYLLPIYRSASTYPNILDESIQGNLEHSDLSNIRKKAWKIVSRK